MGVFNTWREWFSFLPIAFCFIAFAMFGFFSFFGSIAFFNTKGYPALLCILLPAVCILVSMGVMDKILKHSSSETIKGRLLKLSLVVVPVAMACFAFTYGAMISLDNLKHDRDLFLGITVESSPIFLTGVISLVLVALSLLRLSESAESETSRQGLEVTERKGSTVTVLADWRK